MLDFKSLEQAFADVVAVGHITEEVVVNNIPILIRTLKGNEDMEAMSFAQEALEEEEENLVTITNYSDRYKIAVLSYAIMGVGDQQFQDDDLVDTGMDLGNGRTRKLPKHDAMREVLAKWPRNMLIRLAQKYSEIEHRAEKNVEEAIELDPPDRSSEIERLKERIRELEERETKTKALVETPSAEIARQRAGLSHDPQPVLQNQAPQQPQAQAPPPPPVQEAPRQPQAPPQVQYPASQPQAYPSTHSMLPTEGPPPAQEEPQDQTRQEPLSHVQDSMVDMGDPENMHTAMLAEEERWLRARRQQVMAQQQDARAQPMVSAVPVRGRRAPHAGAAQAAAMLEQQRGQELQSAGTMGGVEAFTMPGQELSDHSKGGLNPNQRTIVNAVGDDGSANPNFKPAQKRRRR